MTLLCGLSNDGVGWGVTYFDRWRDNVMTVFAELPFATTTSCGRPGGQRSIQVRRADVAGVRHAVEQRRRDGQVLHVHQRRLQRLPRMLNTRGVSCFNDLQKI